MEGPQPVDMSPLPRRDRATLIFVDGPTAGSVVALDAGTEVVLGRGASAQVRIPEDTLSREHARVACADGTWTLRDLGSLSGTFVEGRRVTDRALLFHGARVQLGQGVRFRFELHDVQEQRTLVDLHEAAMRDGLTGAYTRRYLHERLKAELSYAARHDLPVALLMLDVDHFKAVNDAHGHPAGDAVLRIIATQLKRMLRPEDVLVRYGGEEFCVLLRGLDRDHAYLTAERLRRAVSGLSIPLDGEHLNITISVGVAATSDRARLGHDTLLELADRALYEAKRAGRDRTRCSSIPPPPRR